MASATFPLALGGDGSTVTDDANATTGLANGGHRTRFVPALQQTVNMAATAVSSAASAQASAQSALNYPNTQATSTTSHDIGTGSKTFTLAQTGKAFVVGTYVQIVSTASPGAWLVGAVTAFSGTSLTVQVVGFSGAGTFTSWTISLSCPPLAFLAIRTPVPTTPLTGASNVSVIGPLTASAYGALYDEPRSVRRFQVTLATDPAFASPVVNTTINANSLTLGTALALNTAHLWRCRDEGALGSVSDWSAPQSFTTEATNYIPTPAATPAIGDSFEGGIYAGMVWEEVTQSATSRTLATGEIEFTVTTNMAFTRLFYAGQQVEVRSRANPAVNRFIGTVGFAAGTTLRVNVSSINGSGTFSDWSVMARYRIIVAPKASGESASLTYGPTTPSVPAAQTPTGGYAASLALVAAGTYPAAAFCRGLSIGGYLDWYLPALDELEVCIRNLKPVTVSNATGATTGFTGATDGSLNTASQQGLNENSSPSGAAYTSTVPGQTSVSAFQSGGTEAFASSVYWTSTQDNGTTTNAWIRQATATAGQYGLQNRQAKTTSSAVRAVRRSII